VAPAEPTNGGLRPQAESKQPRTDRDTNRHQQNEDPNHRGGFEVVVGQQIELQHRQRLIVVRRE
jgi:hypothetical protein